MLNEKLKFIDLFCENRIIKDDLTIWHENKGGNISPLPYSCALRSGAPYNYLLVNGERRLTEREMLRLQGFPEDYKIVVGYQAMRKLAGNSVAIPCVEAVLQSVLDALEKPIQTQIRTKYSTQKYTSELNLNTI